MARYLIVVEHRSDWRWSSEGLDIRTADEYLMRHQRSQKRPQRVINLCRRYTYLSAGYYCSLLAEARSDLPMPTVADILDLSRRSLYAYALPDLERILQRSMARLAEPPQESFTLHIFFGHADDSRFQRLAAEVFDLFRYPLLKLRIDMAPQCSIRSIRPLGLHQLRGGLGAFFEERLRAYTRLPKRRRSSRKPALYDLAILHNPAEPMPPSNAGALQRFVKAAQAMRMDVELILPRHYHRIAEFDALFIRETTGIDDHTFRFARKAEAEGMPVIDDPGSILRCTNKVYMWELLSKHGLPTPATVALNQATFNDDVVDTLEVQLGYPMVLKIPDGSFSRGMFKADRRAQVFEAAAVLFGHSRLILAQEFMRTDFDWRIGILNGQPLYASQYFMSRSHWQIVNHKADGRSVEGGFRTMAIEAAPAEVVAIARRAAALIGNGLYGVDLKQSARGIFVIEINDNPNIDHGIEDKVLKGDLYAAVIEEFIRRIEASRSAS